MPARRSGIRSLITAAIFIILEIAAVSLMRRTSVVQNSWLDRTSHRTLAAIWGWTDNVRNYFSLAAQNESLALENNALARQVEYYRSLFPADSLCVVPVNPQSSYTLIPATVVKISRNSQHNYFILNKGSLDGIEPDSGVLTKDGVVGIVDAVDEHYSYGMSLMNNKVSVSVRVGSEGYVTSLVWDGIHGDGAIVKGVPINYGISPSDTVFTSGLSSVFPGDLPIGVVTGDRIDSGSSKELTVKMFQDFSCLRFVTVACSPGRMEIRELEEKEENR